MLVAQRVFACEIDVLWQAIDPLGARADWNARVLSSKPVDGHTDLVEQAFDHPDRKGAPIRRRFRIEYDPDTDADRRGFGWTVVDDSALDPSFWQRFEEHRSLDRVPGGCRLTVTQGDYYRGTAFLLFRWLILRRELAALDNWLKTGRGSVRGWLEHPFMQAVLAVISVLVLWPFFGLSKYGLFLSATLTAIIVLHELGHMAAYRACGHRTARMIIIPFLGGVAVGGRPYDTLFEVAFCALMGAGMSGFLVSILMAAYPLVADEWTGRLLLVFLLVTGGFNLLNLVPVARFDGAQVLRQILKGPRQLAVGGFLAVLPLLFVGWSVGAPNWALALGLAVLAAMSISLQTRSVRPRGELDLMTVPQRVLVGAGFVAAVVLHSTAIVFAAGNLGI